MKAFLFEERRPGFSSDLERTILRLIRTSAQVSVPWAKRGALMREVRDRLIDDARKQGRNLPNDANTSALERAALDPENKPRTIQILADALDRIAVRTRLEKDNASLRRENEALQKKLEQSRSTPRRGKT
jgi:hypothetical protein